MRRKIVQLVGHGVSVAEVARITGFSRKTVYKWVARREEAGEDGLLDRSRAPHHFERFDDERAEWLLELRRRFPRWGPRKLLHYAARHRPQDEWPARSTVAALLKRHGLVDKRAPRPVFREPFLHAGPTPTEPNDRWTMDFKGDFRLGDGTIVKPFTLRDAASRKILDLRVTSAIRAELVKDRLEKAFHEFGMPKEIQSDNGQPFASNGLAQLTALSAWLLRHDVQPVLSRPGKPQDNGAHERMHRDYKAETTRPPAANARAQQARSNRWLRHFNEERPHEALDGAVPEERWKPSPRRYERRVGPPEYPRWWETRSVELTGHFSWRSQAVRCGKGLRHQVLGFKPVDDGIWHIHLGNFAIGIFDERSGGRVLSLRKT
jgi:transposase InsO family protein